MSERLETIEKMIAMGSEDPFHYYARAMELRGLGRLEEALDAFDVVFQRYEDYVPTYLMAAQVAQELDRIDDALKWATAGIGRAREAGDGKARDELQHLLETL